MLDRLPLDKLRTDGIADHFERFARLLTNGTPYQEMADLLASAERLGTDFERRLSNLAQVAEKRGVGLEELLRKQPVAAMDYVIERDDRSLDAALKATKDPVTQASTSSAASVDSPVPAVAPEVEREYSSLRAALEAKAPTTQASTSSAASVDSPVAEVAPEVERDDSSLRAALKAKAPITQASTSRAATVEPPAAAAAGVPQVELDEGSVRAALEARASVTQASTSSAASVDSSLAAVAPQVERDDSSLRAALKATKDLMTHARAAGDERVQSLLAASEVEVERDDRGPGAALKAMKDRMTQALAASDEELRSLLAPAARLKATTERATQASAARDERMASASAVVAALKATRMNRATQAPSVIAELEESLPAAVAPEVDWRAAQLGREAERLGVSTEIAASMPEANRKALLRRRAEVEEAFLTPRMTELLAKNPLSSLLAGDHALLQDFALELTRGTYFEAAVKSDADEGLLGVLLKGELSSLETMARQAGIGLEDLMRSHPGAVAESLFDKESTRLYAVLKARASEAGRQFPWVP